MPKFRLTRNVNHDLTFYGEDTVHEISAKDAERFPEGALESARGEEPKKAEEPPKGKDAGK